MLHQALTSAAFFLLFAALLLALRDRRLVEQARNAGMEAMPLGASAGRNRRAGTAEAPDRSIMIIGATGRSFSEPGGPLVAPLGRCTSARVLLLDPREQGAFARSQGAEDPEINLGRISEEIRNSIACLRTLRTAGASVSLKLYPDMPLFKLVIAGSRASLRHYHPDLNVRDMPEFVFHDRAGHGGFYLPLYRYFLARWNDPDIPEYDFDADELVYHDQLGAEVLREPFVAGMPDQEQEAGEVRSYVFRSDEGGGGGPILTRSLSLKERV